jgi:hypothetical protein
VVKCLRAALLRVPVPMSVVVVLVLLSLTHVGSAGATDIPTTTYLVNTTWTAANSPYVLDGSVTIASGATLTIEPGVVVKFNGTSRSIFVNGALNASGTPSGPIYFTSLADDSIGGDTRGNGPTTGAPGQWAQIKVANGSYLSQLRSRRSVWRIWVRERERRDLRERSDERTRDCGRGGDGQ